MPVDSYLHDSKSNNVGSTVGPEKNTSPKFWYPTVLMNIDFKKPLPTEGVEWLFVRCSTKQIKNGRFDLDIIILDQGGDIVALSHHVALAVGSERNVASRSTSSKM